jgi:DNA-binding IclR family transcriptional regulator
LPSFTSHTITSVEELLEELHQVNAETCALDNEEAEEGVGCIGTLIYDSDAKAVGGLSVSAPIERRRDEWIPLVRNAGRRISERMGYFAGQHDSGH